MAFHLQCIQCGARDSITRIERLAIDQSSTRNVTHVEFIPALTAYACIECGESRSRFDEKAKVVHEES